MKVRGNRWVTFPLMIIGGSLFVVGNIGARTGFKVLPFDPHHIVAQFGGALLLILGLMLL